MDNSAVAMVGAGIATDAHTTIYHDDKRLARNSYADHNTSSKLLRLQKSLGMYNS